MRRFSLLTAALLTLSSFAQETETSASDVWYAGVAPALRLPQGGSGLRRLGGAGIFGGRYMGEFWAVEGSAAWLEDQAGLSLQALGHWQGCELYGRYFGYSRFDPFFTAGAGGWVGRGRGEVGPKAGVGAYYHLTDSWSLRGDADATLGLDRDVTMVYTLALGVRYSF